MPKISKDCELEYISKIQKYVKKDPKKVEKLKIKLLNDNIKTVQYLARKFSRNNSESYDDLYQEGCLGFFYAIEKFEEGKGVRLATYASWWVRQYIQQYLHQHKRTIRMPVHITDQAGKIQKAKIELKEEYGRNPTDTELSNYLNLTDKQIIHVETSAQSIASLDFVIGDDTTLGDVIEDEEANSPDQVIMLEQRKHKISMVLKTLSAREERVLRLRFGIDSVDTHTLDEIGALMNLTKERIRQIERDAINKLSKSKEELKDLF